jgi:hypothetical protein
MKPSDSTAETQAVRSIVRKTWTQPASFEPDSEQQEALLQVDTPLVLVRELKRFTVYWAPEFKAVVMRALPIDKDEWLLESGIDVALGVLRGVTPGTVILDFSADPALARQLGEPPWIQLVGASAQRILITPEPQTLPNWHSVRTFRQASVLLRVKGLVSDETDNASALLRSQDSVLIGGSYAGCVYWLPRSRTVAFIWGGHDSDQHGCRILYAAATTYTQFLRVKRVIADVSNRTSMDSKGRSRLQHFIESAVFRGANKCILVGALSIKADGEESLAQYLQALGTMIRVESVKSLTAAVNQLAEGATPSALDS